MKRGLLDPTGNVECDLLAFAANRQFSATSPELPPSAEHNHATSSIAKDGYACRARRPLTGLVVYANTERKTTRKSRSQSAYESRWEKSVKPICADWSADDRTEKSRYGLHDSKTGGTESVLAPIHETRKQMNVSEASRILRRSPMRTQSKKDDKAAKLRTKLQPNLCFREKSQRRIKTCSYMDNKCLDQHGVKKKFKARRCHQEDQPKNPQKNVRWKNSVVLRTGSDFDNLIRSGVIAKHIAKRERKQRC